jgi:hypothetical protein
MQIRRVLALSAVAVLALSSLPVLAQKKDAAPKRSQAEQQDIEALVRVVEASLTSEPVLVTAPGAATSTFGAKEASSGDIKIAWVANHFVKGQDGSTYIPYTLTVDRQALGKDAALYVRILNAEQAQAAATAAAAAAKDNKPAARTTYAWEDISFIEIPNEGQFSRAIQLKPGKYVAYLAVKEKGKDDKKKNDKNAPPVKSGLLRHELVVPEYNAVDLTTSTAILAASIEPMTKTLSPKEQESNPYVFGPMRVVPQLDGKYTKAQELNVMFWIYGARETAGGKPDVTVDFAFHQKLPEGEKYFNRTAPQVLNAESLPPDFSSAAGHQLSGGLTVPLASFPAGDYRLEIKVTDKPSGKSVTQNAAFTVAQ